MMPPNATGGTTCGFPSACGKSGNDTEWPLVLIARVRTVQGALHVAS